jgi:uncharacterized membrane protein YdbT with pleckstrin-like domain
MDLHPGEEILFEGHPSWRSVLSFYLKGLVVALVVGVVLWLAVSLVAGILGFVVAEALVMVVGFVKRVATDYTITSERLHIRRGILAKRVQQTSIDRVQNVNTDQSVIDRMLRVGKVDFDTAGTDDSDFTFDGVANPEDVVSAVDRAQRARRGAQAPQGL